MCFDIYHCIYNYIFWNDYYNRVFKIQIIKWVEKTKTVFFITVLNTCKYFLQTPITLPTFFSTKKTNKQNHTFPSISVRAQASSPCWDPDQERPPQRVCREFRLEDLQIWLALPPATARGARASRACSAAGAGGPGTGVGVAGRRLGWGCGCRLGSLPSRLRGFAVRWGGSAGEEALATPRGREQDDPSSEHLPGHRGFLGGEPHDFEHGPRRGTFLRMLFFVRPTLEYISSRNTCEYSTSLKLMLTTGNSCY